MVIRQVVFHGSAVAPSQYPSGGLPEIVVAGRSNVGKSSFINAILNHRKIARVSATPGKTRLLNFFRINDAFYLVDIPGYGYASGAKTEVEAFAGMIETYFTARRPLVHGLLLLDIRREPSADDRTMIAYYRHRGLPVTYVLTKADKLSGNERAVRVKALRAALDGVDPQAIVVFSAKTRENVEVVWGRLEADLPPTVRKEGSHAPGTL